MSVPVGDGSRRSDDIVKKKKKKKKPSICAFECDYYSLLFMTLQICIHIIFRLDLAGFQPADENDEEIPSANNDVDLSGLLAGDMLITHIMKTSWHDK